MCNSLTAKTVIEVLLVDDEEDFLEDVCDALKYQQQIPYTLEVVGIARSGELALELARQLKPDLIVMDLIMSGLDGVQAASMLQPELPNTKVLVFSSFLDFKDITSVVNAGIRGYILKGNLKELIRGIEKVYQGEVVFPPDVIQSLFKKRFAKQALPTSKKIFPEPEIWRELTQREREIFTLYTEGHSRQEIAERLGVSMSTIKTHFHRMAKKIEL